MEIVRFTKNKAELWRNGAGKTWEITRKPVAVTLGTPDIDWDWRVSIAEVSEDGNFSPYPGMERVITIIEGEHMILAADGVEHDLNRNRPFHFSGDAVSRASLPAGRVRDLNVITRKGFFKSFVSIERLSTSFAQPVFEGQIVVLLDGEAVVTNLGHEPEAISRYDAALNRVGSNAEIKARGTCALVSLIAVTTALRE